MTKGKMEISQEKAFLEELERELEKLIIEDAFKLSLAAKEKRFRFLNLPPEIRNRVYELLLGEPESFAVWRGEMGDVFEEPKCWPQILRTCRQVHSEARPVMIRANLLFEVEYKMPDHLITPIYIELRWFALPTYQPARAFTAVKHKIILLSHGDGDSISNYIPLRYLHLWCQALTKFSNLSLIQGMVHEVSFKNCFANGETPTNETFWTKSFADSISMPYRSLRGFPSLRINGPISDADAANLTRLAAEPLTDELEGFLDEIKTAKERGEKAALDGNEMKATQYYSHINSYAGRRIWGTKGQNLCRIGGPSFVNEILKSCFSVFEALTELHFKHTNYGYHNGKLVAERISHYLGTIPDFKNLSVSRAALEFGATWSPTATQIAKTGYLDAVTAWLLARALEEDSATVETTSRRAVESIERAHLALPTHKKISEKRKEIIKWREALCKRKENK